MVLAGHDDGGLLVAEALNEGEGVRVLGDVDLLLGDALLVEGAVGRVALGAAGLGVDGDRHVRVSLRPGAGRCLPNWLSGGSFAANTTTLHLGATCATDP